MIPQPKPFLSFDDWLAAERASLDGRTEYSDVVVPPAAAEASLQLREVYDKVDLPLRVTPGGRG